MFLLYFCN